MQNTVPAGTILRNQYLVKELLSKGTFSAVYVVSVIRLVEEPPGKRYVSTDFALQEVIIPNRQLQHQINFEAIPLKGLSHEALPHTYEVFNSNKYNRLYILMDYIEGPNLEKLRSQQPDQHLPWSQVMNVMAPIIDAISYLHSQQPPVIHQNIEPTSIILSKTNNRAVLVDFGVGKKYNLSSLDVPVHHSVSGYEAPEQYSGEEIDARTDIYALGATFYTLLTGIVPPDALCRSTQLDNAGMDLLKPVNEVAPTLPAYMAVAIQQAMAIEAYDRFPSVGQFWKALYSPKSQLTAAISPSPGGAVKQVAEKSAPLQKDIPYVEAPELGVSGVDTLAQFAPDSLSPAQQNGRGNYSPVWPGMNVEMSFTQSDCEWLVSARREEDRREPDGQA